MNLGNRRLIWDFIYLDKYTMGRNDPSSVVFHDRTRDNTYNLKKHENPCEQYWTIKPHCCAFLLFVVVFFSCVFVVVLFFIFILIVMRVEHWNKFHREFVTSPHTEMFSTWINTILGNLPLLIQIEQGSWVWRSVEIPSVLSSSESQWFKSGDIS